MIKLIKKAIKWAQMKRDIRFKKRIERYFASGAKINLTGDLFVNGSVTGKSVIDENNPEAFKRMLEQVLNNNWIDTAMFVNGEIYIRSAQSGIDDTFIGRCKYHKPCRSKHALLPKSMKTKTK